MDRLREVLREGLSGVRRGDLAVADHRVEHDLLPVLGGRPVDERVVDRRTADDPGEHRRLRQVKVLGRLVEIDLRRGRGAPCGVSEEHAVQVPLEDLRLRIVALDLEREQRLAHLAVKRRLAADQTQLYQLLGDRRGAFDRGPGLIVDDRCAHDSLRVDARLRIEVVVLDRDDRLREQGAHLRQRFVVALVTRRVQVREQRLVVGRIDQGVLCNGRVHLARVGQLVRERDVAR